MKTIKELEKELKRIKMCFDRCDNQRSAEGQREYAEIRKLELEIRKLREKGGVPVFGLGK